MQNQLSFSHSSFQTFMVGMTAKRKRRTTRKLIDGRQWMQLAFRFVLRALVKAKHGFTWTREDGKKIWCRSMTALVKAVREYDGLSSKMLPVEMRCKR
jgi:hypothetical protein